MKPEVSASTERSNYGNKLTGELSSAALILIIMTMIMIIVALFGIIAATATLVLATPEGPTINSVSNTTRTPATAALLNTSGGTITTIRINATTQNSRWKAFVGNVSGTLTLDDASASSIYQWSVISVSGEVYATRKSATVSWSAIACANITHITNEENNLSQTNPNDNISKTFSSINHTQFYVGTTLIANNTCRSIHTYVNDGNQSLDFQEILLYDGSNDTNGNLVYTTTFQSRTTGYDGNTYDFQLIVPENGAPTWTSSTAYYFYVELT